MFRSTQPASLTMPIEPNSFVSGCPNLERQLFDCLPLGLVVFDLQGRVTYRNPAADLLPDSESLVNILENVVISPCENWDAVLHQVTADRLERRIDQVRIRDNSSQETRLNLLCLPLFDTTGEVTGGLLVIEDVTAQTGLEQRLALSERMAAVGRLAGRVAHELNNPLDGTLRYLNLALRAAAADQPDRLGEYLAEARSGLLRMTGIVRELVAFSRKPHGASEFTGINAAIDQAIKVLADQADEAGVSIVCRLEKGMPATRGTSLFQVFCNLIKNAIDAMPDGGRLTIVTEIVGSHAVIRFKDTGVGLPANINCLFEPFFTTKPPGKGTGLGLAICKDLIEKHHGRITASRRPKGGSVFTIKIPLESCVRTRRPQATADSCESQKGED